MRAAAGERVSVLGPNELNMQRTCEVDEQLHDLVVTRLADAEFLEHFGNGFVLISRLYVEINLGRSSGHYSYNDKRWLLTLNARVQSFMSVFLNKSISDVTTN